MNEVLMLLKAITTNWNYIFNKLEGFKLNTMNLLIRIKTKPGQIQDGTKVRGVRTQKKDYNGNRRV